jgi:hypothetical protein
MRVEDLEEWRGLTYFPGYEVSDWGRIRLHGEIVEPERSNYLYITLRRRNGQKTIRRVHRLVMEGFKGRVWKGYSIDHINGDRYDNSLGNLRFMKEKDNQQLGLEMNQINNRPECG